MFSAQNRIRLYWTNIEFNRLIIDKGIVLKDILEDKTYLNPGAIRGRQFKKEVKDKNSKIPYIQCLEVTGTNSDKSNCLTTANKDNVLTSKGIGRYRDAIHNKLPYRYYTRLEYERLQTLPEGYTSCVPE